MIKIQIKKAMVTTIFVGESQRNMIFETIIK